MVAPRRVGQERAATAQHRFFSLARVRSATIGSTWKVAGSPMASARIWSCGRLKLMSAVGNLERAVRELSSDELREFREWFYEFDAALWDRQLERDVAGRRLDGPADEALAEHRRSRTRPL